jgi:hypothetical protein
VKLRSEEYGEPTKTLLVPGAGRSGQTWFCYMLAHLLNARFIEPYCLLRGIHHSGLPYILNLTHGDLPDRDRTAYSLVVKTHEFPDRHFSLTRKVILIVRDPRDMITSAWFRYHVIKTTGSDLEPEAQALSLTSRPAKRSKSLKSRIWMLIHGTRILSVILSARKWARFNATWRRLPFVHVVRYEDLLNKADDTMAGICRYLEVPVDSEQIRDTLHKFSFQEITGRRRGVEETENISFRKGTTGDYKEKLTSLELRIVAYFCRKEAKHYGYQL